MPLVLEPEKFPRQVLEGLREELREGLVETLDFVQHPKGPVRDRASLETAEELVRAAMGVLILPGTRDLAGLGSEINLAYATTLAAIDLVKSHADVPKVPAPRTRPGESAHRTEGSLGTGGASGPR